MCVCAADLLTVSEKAKEPPTDETGINAPTSLALEATYINHNFSQQMLVVSHRCILYCVHVWYPILCAHLCYTMQYCVYIHM